MPVARDGLPFLAPAIVLTAAAGLAHWWAAAGTLLLFTLFLLQFFRDPERVTAAPEDAVLSPADGTILSVGPAPEGEAPEGLSQKVVIFMSVFNCHVNRAPISGALSSYAYFPGKKLAAFAPKASAENEQNRIVVEGAGRRVMFKQIAGALARRIVFRKKTGDILTRGERIGMIRFGSRVDLFLPEHATVSITRGQKVKAGLTVLARFGANS